MGLIDKSVTAFFPDARCVLGASVPLLTAIAVLSLVPGCATEYPYRPATQMEQSGDMIGAYHYLANVARKHPNDEVLLERVFQDGHRHYDQYVAGESNIPANDLWQRLAYLKAYPRTGLPFDSEVDTRIRDREDAIKQVETRIAEAETAKDRRHTLAILKELAPYAPYSPKIQFVKDACLKQFVMQNEDLDAQHKLLRIRELKPYEPLPPETLAAVKKIVDGIVRESETLSVTGRIDRLRQIWIYGSSFPAVQRFQVDTLKSIEAEINRLRQQNQPFEAAKLAFAARNIWSGVPLFADIAQRICDPLVQLSLAKADEVRRSAGDKRPATELVYALTAWRCSPTNEAARARVRELATRLPAAYGMKVACQEIASTDDFTLALRKDLQSAPVAVFLPVSRSEESAADGVLTFNIKSLRVATGCSSSNEYSTFQNGFSQKPNPELARAQQAYELAREQYQAVTGTDAPVPRSEVDQARQAMVSADQRRANTPPYIQEPRYDAYVYQKTVYTLAPTVSIAYAISDPLDGKKCAEGIFSYTKQVALTGVAGASPSDAKGVVNRAIDLDKESLVEFGRFTREAADRFAAEIRGKCLELLLRSARRSVEKGRTDEARDRFFAYKSMETSLHVTAVSGSAAASFRALDMVSVPAKLEALLAQPPDSEAAGKASLEWDAVVRETAGYGRSLPGEYADLARLVLSWDPKVIEFKPPVEGLTKSSTPKVLKK